MPGFFRQESITPFAADTSLVCIAVDRSSNPDNTYYYQKIVDIRTLNETPLALLALVENSMKGNIFYNDPMFQGYFPPIDTLPNHIPIFATGSPHTSVIALLFRISQPDMLVRFIDTKQYITISEQLIPYAQTVQFNESGTLCFVTLNTGCNCYRVDNQLTPLFQSILAPEYTVPNQAAWCGNRWCIFQRTKSVWHLALLDETSGELVDKIRLQGRPASISAARSAPIVVCGLANSCIQVIHIDTKRSVVIRHHASTEPNNRMDVSVAPDGLRVATRGTYDQILWTIACGQDRLTELLSLPDVTIPMSADNVLISTPGFCMLNDRCAVLKNGAITTLTDNLPPVTASMW